jgi:predicted DNA-binding protein with PD1-like motif
MQAKQLGDGSERSFILVFRTGDEVATELTDFAKVKGLASSHFTAIGALSDVTFAWFDWEKKTYQRAADIQEQVEVLSLIGDIVLEREQPKVHAHIVVGKRDGVAYGGHLMQAHVRPTLEVILTESPKRLQRQLDPESGLALIHL